VPEHGREPGCGGQAVGGRCVPGPVNDRAESNTLPSPGSQPPTQRHRPYSTPSTLRQWRWGAALRPGDSPSPHHQAWNRPQPSVTFVDAVRGGNLRCARANRRLPEEPLRLGRLTLPGAATPTPWRGLLVCSSRAPSRSRLSEVDVDRNEPPRRDAGQQVLAGLGSPDEDCDQPLSLAKREAAQALKSQRRPAVGAGWLLGRDCELVVGRRSGVHEGALDPGRRTSTRPGTSRSAPRCSS
jgi:hypothetical protein